MTRSEPLDPAEPEAGLASGLYFHEPINSIFV